MNYSILGFGIILLLSTPLFAQISVASNGSVGVGITDPVEKLVVKGGHGDTSIRLFSDGNNAGLDSEYSALMTLWAGEPWLTWGGVGIGNNIDNYGSASSALPRITNTRGGSFLRLLDDATHVGNVDIDGIMRTAIYTQHVNVGIGTSGLTHKLTVSGPVRATSFISDTTSYADFVFDPSYRLAPLSEVEEHIAEYGHLPDIPSEAEVKGQGIDLAEMQVALLQKIEELTLHAISQEKRIQKLEADNQVLKSSIQ